mmetsp:Transcript_29872/g.49571  ORF Transcript_29872/g.49571 Transcript_29872/m.49571 type:complete len:81 (-) Transcript_29872:342-584(-)
MALHVHEDRLQNRIEPSFPVAANMLPSGVKAIVFTPIGVNVSFLDVEGSKRLATGYTLLEHANGTFQTLTAPDIPEAATH